ncbi:MAG: flavodoxin family protein [Candidatus Methanomethylophilus sp.]|jgi:multimeric flavodoxin WrbA|nr:flavodoxin family protein [Methanomethylophilus sp.]MCI2074474.1 flavodoxin family protein [Methanomethylophilus sp.]MCI2093873.1 flavodoxin family protein [Methanomethylophilus sp.]WII09739.1 flavodoxin family protein [Methanomassiliicoccales archaeon LGM-DZ1]
MTYIVILNGSPRPRGNTASMIDAFEKEAAKLGIEVRRYNMFSLNIRDCKECNACYRAGGKPCIQKDDFNPIAEDIRRADGVIFSSPVFWFSMTANLKLIMDRMYCYSGLGFDVGEKKVGIIAAAGDDEEDTFECLVDPIEKSCDLLNWNVVGKVLAGNVMEMSDADKAGWPAKAAELAHAFV